MSIANIAPLKTQANTIALIEVEFIWSRIYHRSVYSLKTHGDPLTRFPFRSTLSSTRSAIVVAAVKGRNCQKYLGGNYRQRGALPSLERTKCLVTPFSSIWNPAGEAARANGRITRIPSTNRQSYRILMRQPPAGGQP